MNEEMIPFDTHSATPRYEITAERAEAYGWRAFYRRLRSEIDATIMIGSATAKATGLIGILGIMNWCGYCGGWHGGTPPRGYENLASPVPKILRQFIEREVSVEGKWQSGASIGGQVAKERNIGEKTELLWGGTTKDGTGRYQDDGTDHGHLVTKDGLNANLVREPGPERDTPVNDKRQDPYGNTDIHGRYDFS